MTNALAYPTRPNVTEKLSDILSSRAPSCDVEWADRTRPGQFNPPHVIARCLGSREEQAVPTADLQEPAGRRAEPTDLAEPAGSPGSLQHHRRRQS